MPNYSDKCKSLIALSNSLGSPMYLPISSLILIHFSQGQYAKTQTWLNLALY